MSHGEDDAGYAHSGYDGWFGDDQPRPPDRGGGKGGRDEPPPGDRPPPEEGDGDQGGELNITMRAPADAKGGRVQVIVTDREGQPLATDHGELMGIIAREKLVARLCKALALEGPKAENFAADINKAWLAFYKAQQEQLRAGPAQRSAAELLEEMPEGVRRAAELMLEDPRLIRLVEADVAALGVAGEEDLALTLYFLGVSRLLRKPLSGRVHGPTSSGKSYVIEVVTGLFPPEAVLRATQMTPQALYHMPPDSLRHRLIVAGERSRVENDETAEVTRPLREMQASGRLYKLIAAKRGNAIETVTIEQEGPIAFVESTTLLKVFDEDANRCLALFTDERPEQTKRIVLAAAARYGGAARNGASAEVVQRHHALQRLLTPYEVVIPYAERLAQKLDHGRVELRRGFPQVMSTVQAIALLHQRQRERDGAGRLVATPWDYATARDLLAGPMARLLGGAVSQGALRFLERLKGAFGLGEFTTTEARKKETASPASVKAWANELHEAGLLKLVAEGRGSKPAVWRVSDEADAEAPTILPTLDCG